MRSLGNRRPLRFAALAAVLALGAGCRPELPEDGAGPSGPGGVDSAAEAGIQVVGTVADGRTGEPVAGAIVTRVDDAAAPVKACLAENSPQAQTDKKGAFSLLLDSDASGVLECRAGGFAVARHPLRDGGEGRVQVAFALQPGGTVEGSLLQAGQGEPVDRITVVARPLDNDGERSGALMFEGTSGEEGRFILEGLPQGAYEVEALVRPAGMRVMGSARREVRVGSGGKAAEVQFRVYQGAAVRGTVVNMASQPVAEAEVRLLPGARTTTGAPAGGLEALSGGAHSSDDGRFVLAGLAYDTPYRIYAASPDYAPALSQVFRLEPGGLTPNIALVLLPGSTIAGHVGFSRYRPAAGVTLRLEPLPGTLTHGLPPRETTTDGQGAFAFDKTPPGKYRIVPLRQDGAPLEDHSEEVAVDGVSPAEGNTLRVSRRDWQGVAARPTADLEGEVLDPLGEPAAGIPVEVREAQTGELVRVAKTDAQGRFKAPDVPVDTYALTVRSELGTATAHEAAPGQLALLRLDPPLRVEGVVRTPEGAPAAGAKVKLAPQGLDEPATPEAILRRALHPEEPAAAEASEEGRFVFSNVAPGTYRVRATGGKGLKGVSEPFAISPDAPVEDVGVDLHLELAIEGVVADSQGEPVRGAMVRVQPWPADAFALFMATVVPLEIHENAGQDRTGRTGEYRVAGLAPGAYRVGATHPEFASLWRGPVELNPETPQAEHRLVLQEGGRVEGAAVDGAQPLAGITVQMLGEKELRSGVTDAEGRFAFSHVVPGEYLVNAVDPKHREAARQFEAFAMTPRVISVNDAEATVLTMDWARGVTVRGVVKGADLGELVLVSLRHPDGPAPNEIDPMRIPEVIHAARFMAGQSLAGPDGSFALRRIPPGDYTLDVVSIALDAGEPDLRAMLKADRTPRLQIPVTVANEPIELNLNVEPGAAAPPA